MEKDRKYNMLVCFTKYNIFEEVIDRQYHYFREFPERIECIHDPIFRAFLDKGYMWSSIEFPEELADKCMFTQSKYRKEVEK